MRSLFMICCLAFCLLLVHAKEDKEEKEAEDADDEAEGSAEEEEQMGPPGAKAPSQGAEAAAQPVPAEKDAKEDEEREEEKEPGEEKEEPEALEGPKEKTAKLAEDAEDSDEEEEEAEDAEAVEPPKEFVCNLKYKKIGCYADKGTKDKPLASFLMSDQDMGTTAKKGKMPKTDTFNGELPKFACKCANEALTTGNAIFGLQNLAECWSGPDDSKYDKDGASDQCITFDYAACADDSEICAGKKGANFMYFVDTPDHTKTQAEITREMEEIKKEDKAAEEKLEKEKAKKETKKVAKKGKKKAKKSKSKH